MTEILQLKSHLMIKSANSELSELNLGESMLRSAHELERNRLLEQIDQLKELISKFQVKHYFQMHDINFYLNLVTILIRHRM